MEKYKLAIACLFKDSAFYLREWLAFHKSVGVEHFYLSNNESTDGFQEILKPYIDRGEVDLFQEKKIFTTMESWESTVHVPFFNDIITLTRGKVEWLACIDSDEFIVPKKCDTIVEVLDKHKDKGSICVNWQLYGTSGIKKLLPGELLTEKLIRKLTTDHATNRHVKSIVQPVQSWMAGPHISHHTVGFERTLTNGCIVRDSIHTNVCIDELQINHYNTGDENYFETYKVPFYKKIVEQNKVILLRAKNGEFNDEEDFSMKRFIPAIKKQLEKDDSHFLKKE